MQISEKKTGASKNEDMHALLSFKHSKEKPNFIIIKKFYIVILIHLYLDVKQAFALVLEVSRIELDQ